MRVQRKNGATLSRWIGEDDESEGEMRREGKIKSPLGDAILEGDMQIDEEEGEQREPSSLSLHSQCRGSCRIPSLVLSSSLSDSFALQSFPLY